MTRLLLPALIVAVLAIPTAGVAGGEDARRLGDPITADMIVEDGRFAAAGCFTDPTGDTVRLPEREREADPRADIIEFCVDYSASTTALSVTVPGSPDPSTDPGWTEDSGVAMGFRDAAGAQRELQISTQNNDGVLHYLVLEGSFFAEIICEGPASFQPGGVFVADVPSDCINGGPTLEVNVVSVYGSRDAGVVDAAPHEGGLIAIPREAPAGADRVTRLAGEGRAETAIEVSQAAFDDGAAGAVLLASQNNFPDAVVGAPLAAAVGGPVLLTRLSVVPDPVLDEIERVLPAGGDVYILGGPSAIGSEVAEQLGRAGYEVTRLSGDGRIDTALEIAETTVELTGTKPRRILLAPGGDFPEALLAGAYAPLNEGVALLINSASIPAQVQAFIDANPDAQVLGVGPEARELIGNGWAGATPGHTSALMGRSVVGYTEVAVATYESFPDGLAGGAFAAQQGIPLFLSASDAVDVELLQHLEDRGPFDDITVFGGTAAISETAAAQLSQSLR